MVRYSPTYFPIHCWILPRTNWLLRSVHSRFLSPERELTTLFQLFKNSLTVIRTSSFSLYNQYCCTNVLRFLFPPHSVIRSNGKRTRNSETRTKKLKLEPLSLRGKVSNAKSLLTAALNHFTYWRVSWTASTGDSPPLKASMPFGCVNIWPPQNIFQPLFRRTVYKETVVTWSCAERVPTTLTYSVLVPVLKNEPQELVP